MQNVCGQSWDSGQNKGNSFSQSLDVHQSLIHIIKGFNRDIVIVICISYSVI